MIWGSSEHIAQNRCIFESTTSRQTFETNAIITTPSIQALYTSSVTGYLVVFVHIADIQQLTEQRLSESDFFVI